MMLMFMRVSDNLAHTNKITKERHNRKTELKIVSHFGELLGKGMNPDHYVKETSFHLINPSDDPKDKRDRSPIARVGKDFYEDEAPEHMEDWSDDPHFIMYRSDDTNDDSGIFNDSFTIERTFIREELYFDDDGNAVMDDNGDQMKILAKHTIGAVVTRCVDKDFSIDGMTTSQAIETVLNEPAVPFSFYDDKEVFRVRCCNVANEQPTDLNCINGNAMDPRTDWRVKVFIISADRETRRPKRIKSYPDSSIKDAMQGAGFTILFDRAVQPTSLNYSSFVIESDCMRQVDNGSLDRGFLQELTGAALREECDDSVKKTVWNRRFMKTDDLSGSTFMPFGNSTSDEE